jgi:hypothetical protein
MKKLSVQDCIDMKYMGALQDYNLKLYFVPTPEVESLLACDAADLYYYQSVVG